MKYLINSKEVEKINERLDSYEKMLKEILKRSSTSNVKKVERREEDECRIHLSFAGLNKIQEE